MDSQTQSFKSLIDKSQNILLVFPYVINSDSAAAVSLFYKYLNSKGKRVNIAASKDIPERFKEILSTCGVDSSKLIKEIKPVSYIVSVNDAKDNVDIAWEKKEDKIRFVLTPEDAEIDFSKISFAKEGGVYDLVITFNANRLEDLGSVYSQNKKQFERYDIASINFRSNENSYAKVSIDDKDLSTLSELVYGLLSDLDYRLDRIDAEILTEGILGSTFGLHRAVDANTYSTISELINKFDINPAEINSKYFYSLSKKALKLRERLLHNVRFDDAKKAIYSTLSEEDFSDIGVSAEDLDGMDYLPFNICKGYDFAFLVFENDGKSVVLIHSNNSDYDLTAVLKKVNGLGNKLYGTVLFTGNIDGSAQKIFNAIANSNFAPKPERSQRTFSGYNQEPKVEETKSSFVEEKTNTARQDETPKSSYVSFSDASATPIDNAPIGIVKSNKPDQVTEQPKTPQYPTERNNSPTYKSESKENNSFSRSNNDLSSQSSQNEINKKTVEIKVQDKPEMQSPFKKSSDFVVDEEADEYKKSQSFTSVDRPFEKAQEITTY